MLTSGLVGLSKVTHQAFKIRFTTITHSGGKKGFHVHVSKLRVVYST